MIHPAALSDADLLRDCDVKFLRRSGPGGQHRNKVETAVRLHHTPTGVEAEANERRSQRDNKRVALRRMRLKLAIGVRCKIAEDAEPSELWLSRCRNRRISISADHADFPAILAEALDRLNRADFDQPTAADSLGISRSQLVTLLRKNPAAFQFVNKEREQRGLRRLR